MENKENVERIVEENDGARVVENTPEDIKGTPETQEGTQAPSLKVMSAKVNYMVELRLVLVT